MRCNASTGYPPLWPLISALIRYGREGGRCAFCGAPDGVRIRRLRTRPGIWRHLVSGESWTEPGPLWLKPVRVTLTVAHLDHAPGNCDPSNLAALCNRCHLVLDADRHSLAAAATRRRIIAAAGQLEIAAPTSA